MARKPWVKPQLHEVKLSERPDLQEALQQEQADQEKQPTRHKRRPPLPETEPSQG